MSQVIKTIDLGGVNCYLVKTDVGFILIDTGGCTHYNTKLSTIRNTLEKELEREGCMPGNLKLVILTHGDCDHAGNCDYIRKKFKAPIAMHRSDTELVENPTWGNLVMNTKYRSIVFTIIVKLMIVFNGSKFRRAIDEFDRFKPDSYIDEECDLSVYGFDAKVLHIPGHTKGSIGILTSSGDFFAGDILANMGKPYIAPNAYDFQMLNSSLQKLRKLNIKTVYPGHGKPFAMDMFR